MEIHPVTANGGDLRRLEAQHQHDLAELRIAADTIAAKDARIHDLEREQQILILQHHREH